MADDYNAISDGTYVLCETDVENQFMFFRKDEQVLTEIIDDELMDLYHAYLARKMFDGEIAAEPFMGNVCLEMSDDRTCIRLTVNPIGQAPTGLKSTSVANSQKPNFLKRWLQKIFG